MKRNAPGQMLGKWMKRAVRKLSYGSTVMINAPKIRYRLSEYAPDQNAVMDKPSYSIGSAPYADLVLPHESVGKIHARIERRIENGVEHFVLSVKAASPCTTEFYVRERDVYVELEPDDEVELSELEFFYLGEVHLIVQRERIRTDYDSEDD